MTKWGGGRGGQYERGVPQESRLISLMRLLLPFFYFYFSYPSSDFPHRSYLSKKRRKKAKKESL